METIELAVLPPGWFPDRRAVREFFAGERFQAVTQAVALALWPHDLPNAEYLFDGDLDAARLAARDLVLVDLPQLGQVVRGDEPIEVVSDTGWDEATPGLARLLGLLAMTDWRAPSLDALKELVETHARIHRERWGSTPEGDQCST